MIALKTASLISAAATMVLNAHYGYSSSSIAFYAFMMAALSVAFDVAKCSMLVGASRAWHNQAYGVAGLCFVMFWLCLAYSLHAGVSQLAKDRDAAKASTVSDSEARIRADADYKRLTSELAAMQKAQVFTDTAACSLPKTRVLRDFCGKVEKTKSALKAAEQTIAAITAADPEPQITLFSALSGWSLPSIRFSLAIWPVLLAELCGSVGFYLSSRIKAAAPAKAVQPSWWRKALRYRPRWKTFSAPAPGPAGKASKPDGTKPAKPFRVAIPRSP